MNKEILMRCAYHEGGRVVFAYLADYFCNKIELSDLDAGQGTSMLNGGEDNPIIQKLLSGERPGYFDSAKDAYEVAAKLTIIFSAGTCARVFYENGGKVTEETDLEFPGQDSINIEKLQKFMKECNAAHPDNYVNKIIAGVFERLAKPDIWKAIKNLAEAAVENYDKPLNRYTIEDTLMGSGFKIKRSAVSSGFDIGVSETPDEPVEKIEIMKSKLPEAEDESPLDIVLKNYVRKIRSDWNEEELTLATNQFKNIFAKYGK
jgi:hypothetical protein